MSILNFYIEQDRVLVAVDTLGDGGPFGTSHVGKMFFASHANMLICGRGSLALIGRAAQLVGFLSSLDEVSKPLALELPKIAKALKIEAWLGRYAARAIAGEQELVVFGWSEKFGEMRAIKFSRPKGEKNFSVEDDFVECASPGLKTTSRLALHDKHALLAVASRQLHEYRSELGIGGNLVMAELTRHTLSVTQLGPIPIL